jgi:hypothetical protein
MKTIINNKEVELAYNDKTQNHEFNGINFIGHYRLVDFGYNSKTYLKESELSGDEWRKGGEIWVTLNGKKVYSEFCRKHEVAFAKLPLMVMKVQDFDFDYLQVGRKVYHAGVPSVIDSVCDNGEITLRTEDGKPYEIYGHKKERPDEDDEWYDKDRVHFTDERIYWFRK